MRGISVRKRRWTKTERSSSVWFELNMISSSCFIRKDVSRSDTLTGSSSSVLESHCYAAGIQMMLTMRTFMFLTSGFNLLLEVCLSYGWGFPQFLLPTLMLLSPNEEELSLKAVRASVLEFIRSLMEILSLLRSDELKLYDPAFGSPCSLNTAPPCGIGHQHVSRKSSHLEVGPAAYHLLHHTPPAPSWQPLITTRPFLEKLHKFVTQVVTPPTSSMFHSGFTSHSVGE